MILSEHRYSTSKIKVLKFPEVIRKRPGMYIGPTDSRGVEHMVFELVANAIDQYLAHKATKVEVTVQGGLITIRDDGCGLPFDKESPDKKSTLAEYLLSHLHQGHTPHIHISALGVGMSVVNALCKSFTVNSWRKDAQWSLTYQRGIAKTFPTIKQTGTGRGSRITFEADPTLFSNNQPRLSVIRKYLFTCAHLIPGMTFSLNNECFCAPNGLLDYAYIHPTSQRWSHMNITPFYFHETYPDWEIQAVAAGNWFTQNNWDVVQKGVSIQSWVNGTFTPLQGSHVTGFQEALNDANWLPEAMYIHVIANGIEFSGPCRNELNDDDLQNKVQSMLKPKLKAYRTHTFAENPTNHI